MLLVNDTRIRKYQRPRLLGNLSQLLQDSVSCGIVLVADFFFFFNAVQASVPEGCWICGRDCIAVRFRLFGLHMKHMSCLVIWNLLTDK